jgi:hypothetical protein
MRKRNVLALTIIIGILFSTFSIVAVGQALGPKMANKEYVAYDFKVVYGAVTITSVDASGAPGLIIVEHSVESAVEATLKIDDKVYLYPDDFEIAVTHHVEFNALTGEGLVRTVGTFTFKAFGHPTLTFWGVARMTGFWQAPDGSLTNPEDFRGQGQFELTGTKILNNVDGFGFGDTMFYPPEYTHQYVHQTGFIKGWSLK